MFFLLGFLGCFSAHADFVKPNVKLDLESSAASTKYVEEGLPKKVSDIAFAPTKTGKGLLEKGVPRQYRHLHLMLASAFYSKRKDSRAAALEWLEEYRCENGIACHDFFMALDINVKANVLKMGKAEAKRFEELRASVRSRETELSKKLPPRNGVCGPSSDRAGWLAAEYTLLCPPYNISASGSMCGRFSELPEDCTHTMELKKKLGLDSMQEVISSAYLDQVHHLGEPDCSKPWKAKILCGGGGNFTFTVECERVGNEFPANIHCTEKKN